MHSQYVLGIDEAGRGSVLGPMVVAGVEIEKKKLKELKKLGVRDSKLLPHSARLRLFKEIELLAERIHVECVPAEIIDDMMNFMNLNRIELNCMARIINSSKAKEVYVDLPSMSRKFVDELRQKLKRKVKLVAEHKADERFVVVSSASIIAKVIREREMDKLREKYSSYGDIGSGYPADERTIQFLESYYSREKRLPEETRMCWSTVKDLKNRMSQKKLFHTCSDKADE